MYAIQETNLARDNKLNNEDHPMLQEYGDVFLEAILGFMPKRDIYFFIDLTLGTIPLSKELHNMSTPKLVELKIQLK